MLTASVVVIAAASVGQLQTDVSSSPYQINLFVLAQIPESQWRATETSNEITITPHLVIRAQLPTGAYTQWQHVQAIVPTFDVKREPAIETHEQTHWRFRVVGFGFPIRKVQLAICGGIGTNPGGAQWLRAVSERGYGSHGFYQLTHPPNLSRWRHLSAAGPRSVFITLEQFGVAP